MPWALTDIEPPTLKISVDLHGANRKARMQHVLDIVPGSRPAAP
jgi:hypothetical protein